MVALTFSHIGITVPDLEKAVEFYSKAFDLYVLMEPTEIQHDESAIGQMCDDVFGEGWGQFRIAHLSMGDGIGIELFEFPKTIAIVFGNSNNSIPIPSPMDRWAMRNWPQPSPKTSSHI